MNRTVMLADQCPTQVSVRGYQGHQTEWFCIHFVTYLSVIPVPQSNQVASLSHTFGILSLTATKALQCSSGYHFSGFAFWWRKEHSFWGFHRALENAKENCCFCHQVGVQRTEWVVEFWLILICFKQTTIDQTQSTTTLYTTLNTACTLSKMSTSSPTNWNLCQIINPQTVTQLYHTPFEKGKCSFVCGHSCHAFCLVVSPQHQNKPFTAWIVSVWAICRPKSLAVETMTGSQCCGKYSLFFRKYASGQQLEDLIHKSFDKFAALLEKEKNPVNPMYLLTLLIYNIIFSMTCGKM